MAGEDQDLDDKTEEASPKKREDARRDGKVAQSKELVSAILMLVTTGCAYLAAQWSFRGLGSIFESSFLELSNTGVRDWTPQTVVSMAEFAFKGIVWVVGPIAGAGFAAGVLGNIFQFGLVWSPKPLEPDLNKLSPLNGIKRIFSMDGVFELFKATVKLTIVGVILYTVFVGWLGQSGYLWDAEAQTLIKTIGSQVIRLLFIIAGAMAVMSAADYAFQRFRFNKKLMMTKQEVKEERKQLDGNPHVKARIRSLQRRFATNKMLEAVTKADVVITNPTHFAVAILYDRENMMAPKVVAKGVDHMAQKIKQIARDNGVPCVENVPLARAMYKALKIGQFISKDLYNAVAEVLAYVYRLKGRK
jgi:flagellar biosynthesis protein FlhB